MLQTRPLNRSSHFHLVCSPAERFQAAERSDWRKTSEQTENIIDFQHMQPMWTTRDVSLRVHEGFRWTRLLCDKAAQCVERELNVFSSRLFVFQDVRSVLSRLPGGLRRVERGGGVHAGRAAPHGSVQPPGAVPQPGVPLPVSALHAAGHQHRGRLRQVKQIDSSYEDVVEKMMTDVLFPGWIWLKAPWLCGSSSRWIRSLSPPSVSPPPSRRRLRRLCSASVDALSLFQCISQRWCSLWASRWPAIESTSTPPSTQRYGEASAAV